MDPQTQAYPTTTPITPAIIPAAKPEEPQQPAMRKHAAMRRAAAAAPVK